MGLFGFVGKYFNNGLQVISKWIHPMQFDDTTNRSFDPDSDSISVVHSAINLLTKSLSKLDLKLYKHDEVLGRTPYKEHSIFNLVTKSPNGYQTTNRFLHVMEHHRLMYGNAFAKIHFKAGVPSWLEILHPGSYRGYKLHNNTLIHYFTYVDGSEMMINNKNLIHLTYSVDEDGIMGINPMHVLYRELDNIFQGRITLNNAYKNNLSIQKYIETPAGNFNNEKVKEKITELRDEYTGATGAGKLPVLPMGYKVVSLPAVSIQDAQVLNSIGFSKQDILEFFGVKNLINAVYTTTDFYNHVLQDTIRQYEQEFQTKLLVNEDNVSIEFDIEGQIEMEFDLEKRGRYYDTMWKLGVYSTADLQRKLGKKPSKNSEKHYIQSQYIPVEEYEEYSKIKQAEINHGKGTETN